MAVYGAFDSSKLEDRPRRFNATAARVEQPRPHPTAPAPVVPTLEYGERVFVQWYQTATGVLPSDRHFAGLRLRSRLAWGEGDKSKNPAIRSAAKFIPR